MIADAWSERAEEDLVRHLRLGAADLLQQVVGLEGGQEGVRQDNRKRLAKAQAKSGLVRGLT